MATAWRPSRREFLGATGLALLAAACSGGGTHDIQPTAPGPSPEPGSIKDLEKGAIILSMLAASGPDAPINPGQNRFGFDLSTPDSKLLTGGSPQVWIAQDDTSRASGPFAATWHQFTGYQATGDRSPNSGLPGAYSAQIDVPQPGTWLITATLQLGGARYAADPNALTVVATDLPGAVGSKAVSVKTPVATSDSAIEAICTRIPVCHLHTISLDAALKNGKPTVAVFSTPLLCESKMCGPVTDEVILASQNLGSKANVIHVEEFLPGPSHTPGPSAGTLAGQSPAFKAWHLTSEPWVYAIDTKGVIRFNADGPVTAPEIEAAVQQLL